MDVDDQFPVGERDGPPAVFIVEDEILIRMSLSDYLQQCGFHVLEASNAAEAIEVIQNARVPIGIVFSDIRMPGSIDGLGLAKWIGENRPGLPVILASADATKADVARELCTDQPFFRKPYDFEAMAAQIKETLAARTATRG